MGKKNTVVQFSSSLLKIFRFEVEILSGPVTDAFMRRHPEPPSRIIDVSGANTLDDLHESIFEAFDREDAHCSQFELGGKKPMDRKAIVYSIPECCDGSPVHDATAVRMDSLPLHLGQKMFYWFDFGDDWWHTVTLLATEPCGATKTPYPRIVERKGESPPQYAEWDDDDDDDEDDEALMQSLRAEWQKRKEGIQQLITDFCRAKLNAEYTTVCLLLLEETWRAGIALDRSKEQSWAAGIIHAAACVNFLYDPALQPYVKAEEIAKYFGISTSTLSSKGNAVMSTLGIMPLDPRYCIASLLKDNPLVPMMELGLFGTGPKRKL